jgi:hypothetical protein
MGMLNPRNRLKGRKRIRSNLSKIDLNFILYILLNMDWSYSTHTNMDEYYKKEYTLCNQSPSKEIVSGIWFDTIINRWRVSMVCRENSIIRFFSDYDDCLIFQKEQSAKFVDDYTFSID